MYVFIPYSHSYMYIFSTVICRREIYLNVYTYIKIYIYKKIGKHTYTYIFNFIHCMKNIKQKKDFKQRVLGMNEKTFQMKVLFLILLPFNNIEKELLINIKIRVCIKILEILIIEEL